MNTGEKLGLFQRRDEKDHPAGFVARLSHGGAGEGRDAQSGPAGLRDAAGHSDARNPAWTQEQHRSKSQPL